MRNVVLNMDHLDKVRDTLFTVLDGVSADTMDLKKASRIVEAAKALQHDAKLRLQAAVILGSSETLAITSSTPRVESKAA